MLYLPYIKSKWLNLKTLSSKSIVLILSSNTKSNDQTIYELVLPTGQSFSLQAVKLVSSPTQSAPPLEGGGLLQSLVWVLFPSPQEALHSEKALQFPHCPSKIQIKRFRQESNFLQVYFCIGNFFPLLCIWIFNS